jgi:hypothetical protein
MIHTRRTWFRSVIAGLAAAGTSAAPVAAQGFKCTGRVSDRTPGNRIFRVELLWPNNRVTSDDTDAKGNYDVEAPANGEYVLMVYESNVSTKLADVQKLTGGTNQNVSLTVTSDPKTFSAAFASLRAIETIAAFLMERNTDERAQALKNIRVNLDAELSAVREVAKSLPPAPQAFILAKANNVNQLWATSLTA